MSKPVPIIGKSSGLNTVFDPFQPIEDAAFLAKALNIRITDSSAIERAEPLSPLFALTSGHSLFCDGGACLVHDGGSMFEIGAGLVLSAAKRTGMSGAPMDHFQYGKAIYFGNRSECGIYFNSLALAWGVDTYRGPFTTRQFEAIIPKFDHLANFNGIVLGSYDNALFASELGQPGLWEMKPVWMTDTRITMIKPVVTNTFPVTGGVYVSDEKRIAFLGGLLAFDADGNRRFSEPRATNYPALEWSVAHGYVDGTEFGEKPGLCAVFMTKEGLCIGYPDGQLVNVTRNSIKILVGYAAGATAIIDHKIITTLR